MNYYPYNNHAHKWTSSCFWIIIFLRDPLTRTAGISNSTPLRQYMMRILCTNQSITNTYHTPNSCHPMPPAPHVRYHQQFAKAFTPNKILHPQPSGWEWARGCCENRLWQTLHTAHSQQGLIPRRIFQQVWLRIVRVEHLNDLKCPLHFKSNAMLEIYWKYNNDCSFYCFTEINVLRT